VSGVAGSACSHYECLLNTSNIFQQAVRAGESLPLLQHAAWQPTVAFFFKHYGCQRRKKSWSTGGHNITGARSHDSWSQVVQKSRPIITVNHVITGHEQVQNKRLQRAAWWHSGHTNIKDCPEAVGMAMIIYISGLQSIGCP
jgi:hypothetical protein